MSEQNAEKVRLGKGHKYVVEGYPRNVGPNPGHLSECLLVANEDSLGEDWLRCTCDSPTS